MVKDIITLGVVDAMVASQIQSLVARLPGVIDVNISHLAQRMTLEYDESNEAAVLESVKQAILGSAPNAIVKW